MKTTNSIKAPGPESDKALALGPPTEPLRPLHNNRPLTELSVMFSQPQHLITVENGTHQFTRVYYQSGKYVLHQGTDKLGIHKLLFAEYTKGHGINLLFSFGYRVHVPDHLLQVTYVLEDKTQWF